MAPKSNNSSPLKGTDLVHADDDFHGPEVSPSISVTSTFRAPKPLEGTTKHEDPDVFNPSRHVYSRYTQSVSTRVEKVLSKINDGYAITFSSGLAASYAALVYFKPKRVAISGGYHGCHLTIETYKRSRNADLPIIGLDDDFKAGDLCWLETPLNPTGEARDIKYYADKVHAAGGHIIVDSTFAPPPLQYPFKWGTDVVLHSGTKYFGGHSDLLCGVLVVPTVEKWRELWGIRTFLGSMMGSLESWLLLRSLRTLHLRVPRQSETATALAQWLSHAAGGKAADGIPAGLIEKVWHSSLQGKDARGFDPSVQMEGGYNATFAIFMTNEKYATLLPHALKYFVPATSLGGVESLIEQRIQSDPGADPRLIRISVGVEELEDLKDDLRRAFQEIKSTKAKLLEIRKLRRILASLSTRANTWNTASLSDLRVAYFGPGILAGLEVASLHIFTFTPCSPSSHISPFPFSHISAGARFYLPSYRYLLLLMASTRLYIGRFGFVQFSSEKDALDVVAIFSRRQFLGADVKIEVARPPRRDSVGSSKTSSSPPAHARLAPDHARVRYPVIINNLNPQTCWQELKDFARMAGGVVSFCDVDKSQRGRGFIDYLTPEDAERAVKELNGKELLGNTVYLSAYDMSRGGRTPRLINSYRNRSRSPSRGLPPLNREGCNGSPRSRSHSSRECRDQPRFRPSHHYPPRPPPYGLIDGNHENLPYGQARRNFSYSRREQGDYSRVLDSGNSERPCGGWVSRDDEATEWLDTHIGVMPHKW
ncbi:hypothetical protein A0H81_04003 [Grifola frondosa]|uniref:RRM domain-containing protein n=1 Tax=Grifola frondosa TaxID=5627 RepID=A0A1C7MIV3_GRIFR|nr:hypothetical protein A0H81_04003 [Grifola frondosa]